MEGVSQLGGGRWSAEYADAIGRVAVCAESMEEGKRCLVTIASVHGQYREPVLMAVSTVAISKDGFLSHSLVIADSVDVAEDAALKRWPESEGYTGHSSVVVNISPYVMLMAMAQAGSLLGSIQILLREDW